MIGRLAGAVGVVALALLGAGCFINAQVRAQYRMEEARSRYQQCLRVRPSPPEACEAARREYEAAVRAYRAIPWGLSIGVGSE